MKVLCLILFLQAKGTDALDLAQLINNDLGHTVRRFPDRFLALGTLPMQDPELAVQELIRCKQQLGTNPGAEALFPRRGRQSIIIFS